MYRKRRLIGRLSALLLIVSLAIAALAQEKEVIGYYPSWKWNRSEGIMMPSKIPFEKITMVNYAFFSPRRDGTLAGRDTIGDALFLEGEIDNQSGHRMPGTSLVSLAREHGVPVLLSIGGWEDSDNFPGVAASPQKRSQFAHSCVEQIRRYGFGGIDIDWEYPGFAEHGGTKEDRHNCTSLFQETRDSLDAYGRVIGKHLLLTAALPASETHLTGFEMDNIVPLLDLVNVMTYDFSGTWDPLSGHNAPLFAPNDLDTLRNVDAAFRLFTRKFRVPPAKVTIGVPFYGRTFASCTNLYAPHAGADSVHFSAQGLFYANIVPLVATFRRMWDEKAKVPYLINTEWNVMITYDDEESVKAKAQYVLEQGAGGVIIWELTGDFMPDGRTPLLEILSRTLKNSQAPR